MANERDAMMRQIEDLRRRYQKLDRDRTVAETELKNARQKLEELRNQAQGVYGTSELESLKKKLSDMRAENDRKRMEYTEHLDGIERNLSEIERVYREDSTRK